VAFDAGNLANVAKALRKLYPAALLVLCGDDDVQTEARTGIEPRPPEGHGGGAIRAGAGGFP
jgi:putative DNA primase/helicase